jgi:hypothetical protein
VNLTSPPASVVPLAFTSATTVVPAVPFLTAAYKKTSEFGEIAPVESTTFTVALQSVFFSQPVVVKIKQDKQKKVPINNRCFMFKILILPNKLRYYLQIYKK